MPAPRPQRLVRSAGALVWRFTDPARVAIPGEPIDPADIEVLMVHRPPYHDWSWPKGKAENGEPLVAAAVREVEEETGQIITLGMPLTTQRYRLGGGQTKEVHYWVGTPLPAGDPSARLRAPVARAPRTEIDRTTWATADSSPTSSPAPAKAASPPPRSSSCAPAPPMLPPPTRPPRPQPTSPEPRPARPPPDAPRRAHAPPLHLPRPAHPHLAPHPLPRWSPQRQHAGQRRWRKPRP